MIGHWKIQTATGTQDGFPLAKVPSARSAQIRKAQIEQMMKHETVEVLFAVKMREFDY
jgi:hypothetical protein